VCQDFLVIVRFVRLLSDSAEDPEGPFPSVLVEGFPHPECPVCGGVSGRVRQERRDLDPQDLQQPIEGTIADA